MIWASGTMFGSSIPNASQDGTAGRNVNSELLHILFQHARCAGNQIFDTCILRIPRHFLLRFPCNCYLKCNISFLYNCRYPSLRIEVRKPSYKLCFSARFYGPGTKMVINPSCKKTKFCNLHRGGRFQLKKTCLLLGYVP